MMRVLIHCSLLVLFLSACSKDDITITGKVKNYSGKTVILEKRQGLIFQPIDTFFIKADSSFRISVKKNEPDIYRLNFNYRNRVNVLVSNADFHIEVDAGRINGRYKIMGSPDYDLIKEVNTIYNAFDSLEIVLKIRAQYKQALKEHDKPAMDGFKLKFEQALTERDEVIKDIILMGLEDGAYLGVVEIMNKSVLNPERHLQFYKTVANRLETEIPGSMIAVNFRYTVQELEQTLINS